MAEVFTGNKAERRSANRRQEPSPGEGREQQQAYDDVFYILYQRVTLDPVFSCHGFLQLTIRLLTVFTLPA